MASTGMLHRGRNTGPDGGDEVQRSIELLDSVLSEFEEAVEGGTGVESVPGGGEGGGEAGEYKGEAAGTPDDDSPSLGGHQSEDDGYMSMNGRRTKFALSFRPTEEKVEPGSVEAGVTESASSPLNVSEDNVTLLPEATSVQGPLSPPPPAEAERIISNLLPKVSPSNSSKKSVSDKSPPVLSPTSPIHNTNSRATNTATQTTFPKTRHPRPYGWEKGSPIKANPPPNNQRFSSLPFGSHQHQPLGSPSSWLPPRKGHEDASNNITSPSKQSSSIDSKKPFFPLQSSFGYDRDFVFGNIPYNEHPVTIYPGANVPYTKQLSSPNYVGKSTPDSKKVKKKETTSDGEAMSPKGKLPPRTLAGSIERHHEVCRGPSENNNSITKVNKTPSDEDRFSDDSLEEPPPPPPVVPVTPSKRGSIAWEVPLDEDPLLTPGSTKVIGRRRRKSCDNSNSSTGSIPQRVEEWINDGQNDYWPPPPVNCSTEDEIASPFSDTESEHLPIPDDIKEINATGTYIIRRGKKDRMNIPEFSKKSTKLGKNNQHYIANDPCNQILDGEQSVEGSSLSISAISASESHNSVLSLNSRLSSDLSIPHTRFNNTDFNSRFTRELTTPNSRYSVDLCIPSSQMGKELTSPKSRLSLDLNNSAAEKHIPLDIFNDHRGNIAIDKCETNFYQNKNVSIPSKLSPQSRFTDLKKYSCTFDNIQSLLKEGVESSTNNGSHFDETVSDLNMIPPSVVRVVSLPALSAEAETTLPRQILTTTVEEEEEFETPSQSSEDTSPLKKIENNISALLSQGRDQHFSPSYMNKDWDIHKDEYSDNNEQLISNMPFHSSDRRKRNDIQKSSSHNEIPSRKFFDFHREKSSSSKRNGIHKSMSSKDVPVSFNRQTSSDSTSSSGDFPVHVQIVDHFKLKHDFGPLPKSPGSPQFPPLPPSPVQEDDEYSEILHTLENAHINNKSKADTLPTTSSEIYHRSINPPVVPPHGETGSLKTRSMDTSFSKNRKSSSSSRIVSSDRRTLPSDMGIMSGRRRTLQRQRGGRDDTPQNLGVVGLQTSASLPETPVFGRGCDVPRTPHRRTTDSGPRQSSTMSSIQSMGGSCAMGVYGRGSANGGSMERALAGAELLRLAGGPARGWYPRQRHRPASIEHLERLPMSTSTSHHGNWDSSRKPLTLPPNLTPKFFQKSPREALRRVTSLLIRKGNNTKDNKKEKLAVSPATRSANGEESTQKQRKGFFKNFWKRSRHYSLEHP